MYIAIDLKSFYASVECVQRGLDPLKARLVVADPTRTEKTICLAVTPALKALGIPGRARLFEVVEKTRHARVDFITAPPRMRLYMDVSAQVYGIYLKWIAPEDIHVYSVDEVFIDATDYMRLYGCTAHELALRLIRDVLAQTGITATAGIGTNMYLAKVAMDIEAKHQEADADGVRIAELDEQSYRRRLWSHRPLTDFWRVGRGLSAKLEANGLRTMGDVARCSLRCEELLYRLFGVNAELLIDHAWGWEPCTMEQVKSYRPSSHSLNRGQVLSEPYTWAKARVVAREMVDQMVMELVEKRLVTDRLEMTVCYDGAARKMTVAGRDTVGARETAAAGGARREMVKDWYGRPVPKPGHGSIALGRQTSSTELISRAAMQLFDRIADPSLMVRRIYVVAARTVREEDAEPVQLSLFGEDSPADPRERSRQEAILEIRRRFGKNAILKGTNFEEGATAVERNSQIGGHKA